MTAAARPFITVVTPTHNRRDSVLRLLDRLRDGSYPHARFEVVVVADGCHDDTVAALHDARYPFSLEVLEQNPGQGAATARNRGAEIARGAVLLFIDDDIEPLPTLLAVHAEAHAAAEEPVVVIGAPIPVRAADSDFQHIAVWGWWEQQFERMRLPGHRFSYDQVFSGILSMPAALFSAVGGFEVALNSCRDDSELGLRLIRRGARIIFSREAGGYHHEMRDRTRLILRKRAEGRADVLLAKKYPELWWTLRLSQGTGHSLPLRFLHRAARSFPRLGDVVAGALARSLGPLERFRLRGTWRQVHAGVMYYAYWRGALESLASEGDGSRALAGCALRGEDPSLYEGMKQIDIDLAGGLEAAERLLDRERPDAVRVRLGQQEIERIPALIGAEPLRGAHLRRQLAGLSQGWPLLHATALEALSAGGSASTGTSEATMAALCRIAGALIAQGRGATRLLSQIAPGHPLTERDGCAATLFQGAFGDTPVVGEAGAARWAQMAAELDAFLAALEARTAQPGAARSVRVALERRVAAIPALPRPLSLGLTEALQVEVTAPIAEVSIGGTAERAIFSVALEGEPLGSVELPVCDGLISSLVLRDTIADLFGWRILGRLFERTEYRDIEMRQDQCGWSAWRAGVCVAGSLPDDAAARPQALHDRIGWATLLGALWPEGEIQPPTTERSPATEPEAGGAPPWLRIEAAEPLGDRPAGAARVVIEFCIAGTPVEALEVETADGLLSAARLRELWITVVGYEVARIAVREALLGAALDGSAGLRTRLAAAAERARSRDAAAVEEPRQPITAAPDWAVEARRALPEGRAGAVMARRIDLPGHTAVARPALLPSAVLSDLRVAEALDGTPLVSVPGQGAPLLAYAPSLLWARPSAGPGQRVDQQIVEGAAEGITSPRLPILMYHRVAPAGVAVRDRYRVTPAQFEEQLRRLRDSGYRSVSFDQWRRATVQRRPLPGRVVALTFDDGYLDFRDFAWPLLRRYGFGATVFLVTGSIGRWNSWDREDGQREPLLDWEMVRQLHGEGVEFGAHSVSHRPMSLLSPEEIGREALGSRAAIEKAIGERVTAFAYPYGDEDPVIHHLVGASGFVYGLTTRPSKARLDESLLILPRLEVCGDDDLSAFAAKLSEP